MTPKAFKLLEVLVEARPRALSKADLLGRVWPATFVSEANLTSLITDLREAFGDDAREPRFIRTVHGFGYAFCGEASAVVHPGDEEDQRRDWCHRLIYRDRHVALSEGENLLGRDPEVVAWVDHPSVSRRHARIIVAGGEAAIEDLDSRNGTWRSGARVEGPVEMSDGDRVRLGAVEVIYRLFEPAATETWGSSQM